MGRGIVFRIQTLVNPFYDREAMKLLGLNKDSRLLYLLATGPVKSLIDR